MADLRRPSLRLLVGLAVVVMCLFEVQGLLFTLRSQRRLRDRVVRAAREAVVAFRPRLAAAFLSGGTASWVMAAEEVERDSLASECEVFDLLGNRRFFRPTPSPVDHWPSPEEIAALRLGTILTVGPIMQRSSRLLIYAAFESGGETVLLRLSQPAPELVEDLRERRQILIGHGVALVVLVLAGGLALFPVRDASEPQSRRALDAYEEAMERLASQGQELSRQHEAERRRMEDTIQDKEAMARAGEMTAGIAHEIRNGLGTILGYARMLERTQSPETADAAGRIRQECETLESVIRRFVDFVKRDTLDLASFDLGRLLSRVVARESRSGGTIVLPPTDLGTLVGDEELLERAFENLVRNAREAAGEGGHVWVGAAREGDSVTVTIADDGPGLPPDVRRELRPFFTTKAGGLGLGLPLALKIVHLHGGAMDLTDRFPKGVAVCVRLPLSGPSGGK